MKQCRRCHQSKADTDFSRSRANRDGLHSYCKSCQNDYAKARRKNRQRSDEERAKAREYARAYRYGLTKSAYEAMLSEQGDCCAVCRQPFTEAVRPRVDHDHRCCPGRVTCGRCVRQLLCNDCTSFARLVETRWDTHEAMFEYLHLHLRKRLGTINSTQ